MSEGNEAEGVYRATSPLRARVIERLKRLVGLDGTASAALADAMIEAAIEQSLELAGGTASVPTSVTAVEADRAFYICNRAGRILSQREVEVLFRTTSGRARSILATMRATYAEALAEQFAARVREDAEILATGNKETGLTWTLKLSETPTFQLALDELRSRGLSAAVLDTNAASKRITVARATIVDGEQVDLIEFMRWK